MTKSTKITVQGLTIRTTSHFRYQMIQIQDNKLKIIGRSDNYASALERLTRHGYNRHGYVQAIADLTTGLQVWPKIDTETTTNVDTKENIDMSATATKSEITKRPNAFPAKMADPTKKVTAAKQGFPACYLGETGNFRPGYDARAKADLRAAVSGKDTSPVAHRFTKAQAQRLLAKRGW